MKGSLTKAVYLFAAPLAQTARVVDALRAKVEAGGGSTTAAPEAAASDETPVIDDTVDTVDAAPAAEASTVSSAAPTDVAEGGDES